MRRKTTETTTQRTGRVMAMRRRGFEEVGAGHASVGCILAWSSSVSAASEVRV